MSFSRRLRRASCIAAISLCPGLSYAQENFDQPGTSLSSTTFPFQVGNPNAAFERVALGSAQGAPDTNPPLPINAGGDKEVRYYEAQFAGGSRVAWTSQSLTDASLDGYIAIGLVEDVGTRAAEFWLRADNPLFSRTNGYFAKILHQQGHSTATLGISKRLNTQTTSYFTSIPFPVSLDQENYHLCFSVIGAELTATLWRVVESGGEIFEVPIDLRSTPGVQNSVTVTSDGAYTSGRIGIGGFVRGVNNIFFDDITVSVPVQDCDAGISFQSVPSGMQYGSAGGNIPGEIVFAENGIEASVHTAFEPDDTSHFGDAIIVNAPGDFGNLRVMRCVEANVGLAFDQLDDPVNRVELVYDNRGGYINLQVNGAALYSGAPEGMPSEIAPDVLVEVHPDAGTTGTMILAGSIETLLVGGDDIYVDSFCPEFGESETCSREVGFESVPLGTEFTTFFETVVGAPIWLTVHDFTSYGGDTSFGSGVINTASDGMGDGHVLQMNGITARTYYSDACITSGLVIEYLHRSGLVNLGTSSDIDVLQSFDQAPSTIGSAAVSVTSFPVPEGTRGRITLTGSVPQIYIGGEDLVIDNICLYEPPRCPCLWNDDCLLNSDDVFDFLLDFLENGDADFDDNGITNSEDFFGFLTCFLVTRCP